MNLRKLLTTATIFVASALGFNANAQASYNFTYTEGVAVAEGTDYFLYNVGAKKFLADGMDWGTHATVDNAGRVITFASLGEGKYSIYTKTFTSDEKKGFMTLNGYLDTGTNDANWDFTPVTVDGYTNVYTIKHSDTQYLHYNAANLRVNVGASTGDNYSYWMIVPKTVRNTKGDYSYYLQNTDFNRPWERKIWSGDFTNLSGGNADNPCAEVWRQTFDLNQSINASLPKGKYTVNCQGFYRVEDGNDTPALLYANESSSGLNKIEKGAENNMSGASTSFSNGLHVNSVSTIITGESLKLGIKSTVSTNWIIFDNFTLRYDGPVIATEAISLPADGNIEAGNWYYIDIPADAEYNVAATTIGDIVYTTDGTILIEEDDEVTDNIPSGKTSFVQGRYYVKSTSDNNISVDVASHKYTLGDAITSIADGAFIPNLSTFVVTYSDAETTDAEAELAVIGDAKAILSKGGVTVAEGVLTADDAAKTLTATFADVTLDLSSAYTISIAAGVFGYDGKATNEAITVNFNTPIIANGVYYFKRNGTETYLTRGGNYGTEAVTDKFGIAFEAMVQNDGTYYLKNVDHSLVAKTDIFLNEQYTDQGAYNWGVVKVDGGYYLKRGENYITTEEEANWKYNYISNATDENPAIVWTILTEEEYKASLIARKDAETKAVADAAGISVETLAQFETVLSANYGSTDMTNSITNPSLTTNNDGWTAISYNAQRQNADGIRRNNCAEVWNYIGGAEQTISDLPEGIYRITVKATWRLAPEAEAKLAGDKANVTAWMYANDNYTQLKSWSEVNGPANNVALINSTTDTYVNTVYVYVAKDEELTIGIASPSWCGIPWMPFCHWTLAKYDPKATAAEIEALTNAITAAETKTLGFDKDEYAPYNNVNAVKALAAAKAIDTETASSETVVNATNALTAAIWTVNATEVNAVYDGSFNLTTLTSGSYIIPTGWTNVGYNTRVYNSSNMGDNTGVSGTSQTACMFAKFTTEYGTEEGYTMPLKAGVYTLDFIYGGWNELGTRVIKIYNADNNAEVTPNSVTAKDNQAHKKADSWAQYSGIFEIPADGNYILSFYRENSSSQNQICISDIEIFRAPEVSVTMNISDAKYSTFIAPFDVTIPAGVTASKVTGETTGLLTLEALETTIPANTPVVLNSETAYNNTFTGIDLSTKDAYTVGMLTGVYTATDVQLGWYVLQNNGGKVGFYRVDTEAITKVGANRCYLTMPAGSEAKAFFFGGEATGINAIEALQNGDAEIYTINGTRVNALQKGVNIVKMSNGKTQKVLVK